MAMSFVKVPDPLATGTSHSTPLRLCQDDVVAGGNRQDDHYGRWGRGEPVSPLRPCSRSRVRLPESLHRIRPLAATAVPLRATKRPRPAPALAAAEDRGELADVPLTGDRVRQRQVLVERVSVSSPLPLARDVSRRREIGHNPVDGTLGEP